jgi:hypothetical protein
MMGHEVDEMWHAALSDGEMPDMTPEETRKEETMATLTEDYDGTLRIHFTVSEPMVRLLADMATQYVENSEGAEDTDEYRMAVALQAEFDALLASASGS